MKIRLNDLFVFSSMTAYGLSSIWETLIEISSMLIIFIFGCAFSFILNLLGFCQQGVPGGLKWMKIQLGALTLLDVYSAR